MTEIINPIKQIESYDNPIVVEKIRGLSQSHSYLQWLQSRINIFQKRNNLEMINILNTCKEVYKKFHPELKATVNLNFWKGKDEIKYIEKPDSFEIVTHQRPSQEEEVREIHREISKKQINDVIHAINDSRGIEDKKIGKYIKTEEIARNYCILTNLRHNNKGYELFPNGLFNWNEFFGDRSAHLDLNLILRLLSELLVINYRAGRIKVLKEGFSFQLNL